MGLASMQSWMSRPSACLITFRELRCLGFHAASAAWNTAPSRSDFLDSGSAYDLAELQAARAAWQRRRPQQGGNGRGLGQPARADVSGPDGPCRGRCGVPWPGAAHLAGQRTWTCWIPRNGTLYDLAPPRTGRRGRPAPRASGWAPPTTSSAAAAEWRPSCTPSTARSATPGSPTSTPSPARRAGPRRPCVRDLRPGSGHRSPALSNARHTSMMSTTPRRPASPATGR